MWWLAAEAVPGSPPEVPYETIGTILVALIGAIVAITVAVLQRASKNAAPAAAPPVALVAFAVPEAEWIVVRDRSITTASKLVDIASDLGKLEDRVSRNDGRIEHIKGSLGLE